MTDETQGRLEIDWLKTAAGALAAVSSALLLSRLGAAGTIIGAALGSVMMTIGSTIYTQGLARGRERLVQAQEQAKAQRRVGVAQAEVRRANRRQGTSAADGSDLENADESLEEANAELDAATRAVTPTWRSRLAALPWKRITVIAAGSFLVAMLAITAFELITGKPVASHTGGSDSTGGTSFSQLTGGQQDDDPDNVEQEPVEDPSSEVTPSDDASPSPSTSPSTDSTPSPTSSPSTSTEPDETPTSPLPTDTSSAVPSEPPG